MRILCLHGNRSNGDILKKSMSRLLNIKDIEFVFLTSPFKFYNDNTDTTYRKWWTGNLENIFTNPSYDHLFDSLVFIQNFINNYGIFDGILGFSQGAVLSNIILYLQEYPALFSERYQIFNFNFKFAILCSMSIITDTEFLKLLNKKINLKTLNVFGINDNLLDYKHSQQLSVFFINCIEYAHVGKHYVPSNSAFKKILMDFVKLS